MENLFKEMREELEKQAREAEQSKRELDKKLEKLTGGRNDQRKTSRKVETST